MATVLLLSLLLLGCTEPNQYQPPPPPPVTVARPVQSAVVEYLEETGTTEPVQMVDVRARVAGYLDSVEFEPGADVTEGDLLFVIQPEEYRAKVAAATAALDAAKVVLNRAQIEYDRQEKLLAQEATTEDKFTLAKAERDAGEAQVLAAQAELDQAELNLKYTEIRSPITGRVGKTLVKAGNLVGETEATHLTTVVSYEPIYANFSISEQALLKLLGSRSIEERRNDKEKPDTPVYVKRATDRGYLFEGMLDYADLGVDQSTGTFAVRAIFDNEDQQILPGLFVSVRVPIGRTENALLVPESAVGADQAGRFVLAINSEDVVERRTVEVGTKRGSLVVVTGDVRPDDRIVIAGLQRARPGAKVAPTETELDVPPEESAGETPRTSESTVETPPDEDVEATPSDAASPVEETDAAPLPESN